MTKTLKHLQRVEMGGGGGKRVGSGECNANVLPTVLGVK